MEIAPHYSLVKDHDKHFEIHDSRDNKRFSVSKKDLHPATQIKVMKMQKFSEGGEEKGSDDSSFGTWGRMDDNKTTMAETINDLGLGEDKDALANQDASKGYLASLDAKTGPSAQPVPDTPPPSLEDTSVVEAPQPQVGQGPAQAPVQPSPAVAPASGAPSVGGLNGLEAQEAKGINTQAQGQIEQNKQIGQAYDQDIQRQQQNIQASEARSKQWEAQLQQMSNDIASTKIDPNRYWNSKSTGSKISTALGVMLGGLGAGMAGSSHNQVWDSVQNNINRDIDAQKSELGKKQTLLGDNLRIHGDLLQAENATRLQYSAVMQGQLAKIAAQTGNPMILGAAQQKIAQLKMQDIPLKQQLYQHDLAQRMLQGGGQPQGDGPVDLQRLSALKMSGVISGDDEKEATKEANQLSEVRALRKDYDTTFNELNSKFLAGNLTPGQVDSAKWTIAGKLQHASAGRFNLEDAKKQVEAMFPGPGDWKSTRDFRKEKSNALFDTMEAGTTTLDRLGLKRPYQAPHPNEGKIASNAKGDKLVMKSGKWVPYSGR